MTSLPSAADAAGVAPARWLLGKLPTLAALAAIAVFVAAGDWQGRRMAQKEALRAQFDAGEAAPAMPLPVAPEAWTALRYRVVEVAGEFDARRQILIDNKVHAGRAGYHVVAPLKLDDGRVILVNRGWAAQGATRAALPEAPPPTGRVAVTGRLNVPAAGYIELQAGAPSGTVWQNLDPARYAAATGLAVLPVVIEQAPQSGPADGLVREWPAPDFGIDKHRIYRMQWYAFALLTAGLWLYFRFRRTRPPSPPTP
jgi:surfeit locus 1 family protein